MLDLRRAQEWTDALDGWCRVQAGVVPYRSECLRIAPPSCCCTARQAASG
jgi:hypothetical protein